MSWRRRQYRSGERPERPFRRRFGYETVKETGGTLLQHVGAGLGALTGLVGAIVGLPGTASVIAGAVIGSAVGAVGKAYLNATVDERRERAEKRAALNRVSGRRGGAGAQRGIGHLPDGADDRRTRFGAGRSAAPIRGQAAGASPMNQFIGKLEQVIADLEQAGVQLNALMTQMWESQHRISGTLAGGRPDVVRSTHDRADGARLRVQDAATLSRQAAENLRVYRAGL